ncbi:MAG: hypothetical protein ACREQA_16880 [Candidatus Binatia bacterium]
MARSSDPERAARLNEAMALIQKHESLSQAAAMLVRKFGPRLWELFSARVGDVADRKSKEGAIELEYRYDRLVARKLEQVYQLLVPHKVWSNGGQGCDVKNEVKVRVTGH